MIVFVGAIIPREPGYVDPKLKRQFSELLKAQGMLAQLEGICDNTDYILSCINNSANNIEQLSSKYEVPGDYRECLKLDELKNNGDLNGALKDANSECKSQLESLGYRIDELIQEVSREIERQKNENPPASTVYYT
jgi:hypothetical protein